VNDKKIIIIAKEIIKNKKYFLYSRLLLYLSIDIGKSKKLQYLLKYIIKKIVKAKIVVFISTKIK
jgi:hypothetical protein